MNLKFTITLFGTILLVSALLLYLVLDFRTDAQIAKSKLDKKDFESALSLFYNKHDLSEEEYYLASKAISGLESQINSQKTEKEKLERSKNLQKKFSLKISDYSLGEKRYYKITDPFLKELPTHSYFYEKALLDKISLEVEYQNEFQHTQDLLLILLEDPRPFIKQYSEIVKSLLHRGLAKMNDSEKEILLELINYLSSNEESSIFHSLYEVNGDKVGFRKGPGTENALVAKLNKGQILECFDEDPRVEEIGGTKGTWKECFSLETFQTGFVFSKFLSPKTEDSAKIESYKSRFSSIEEELIVDFQTWKSTEIPTSFHGTYTGSERYISEGKIGFTLYPNPSSKTSSKTICKKLSSRKNYFEFHFDTSKLNAKTDLFSLNEIALNESKKAFEFAVDKEGIFINSNKVVFTNNSSDQVFSLVLKAPKEDFFTADLYSKNSITLAGFQSKRLNDGIHSEERFSWEICLPQNPVSSDSKLYLYGFKIGVKSK